MGNRFETGKLVLNICVSNWQDPWLKNDLEAHRMVGLRGGRRGCGGYNEEDEEEGGEGSGGEDHPRGWIYGDRRAKEVLPPLLDLSPLSAHGNSEGGF